MRIITCVWQNLPGWVVWNKWELMAWSSKSDLGHLTTPFSSNCRWWHCLPTQAWAICPHPSIATVHALPKDPRDRVFFRTDRIHLLFQISINRVLRNSIPRATIWVLALVSWERLPNSHICRTIGLCCPLQLSEKEELLRVILVHFRTRSGWWQVHMINVPEGWPNFRWRECFAKNIPPTCRLAAESQTCQCLPPLLVKLYFKWSWFFCV